VAAGMFRIYPSCERTKSVTAQIVYDYVLD